MGVDEGGDCDAESDGDDELLMRTRLWLDSGDGVAPVLAARLTSMDDLRE